MSTCRYQVTPCTGPGSMDFSLCADCRGPVDLSPGKIDHKAKKNGLAGLMSRADKQPKPAAPATVREEEKRMPTPKRPPIEHGKCPHCGSDGVALRMSEKFFGGGRGCPKCYKRAQNAADRALKKGQQGATKAASAPKPAKTPPSKASAPIAKGRPVPATLAPPVAPRAPGACVTLVLTVFSVAALRQVLALTDGLDGVSVEMGW